MHSLIWDYFIKSEIDASHLGILKVAVARLGSDQNSII